MPPRQRQNPIQVWRCGWRRDVFMLREGKLFDPPTQVRSELVTETPSSETEQIHIANARKWWSEICGEPKYILAPMVGQGDQCFRILCRQEGVKLCYTPMYLADRVNSGAHDVELMLGNDVSQSTQCGHTDPSYIDRPLVCQLAGNQIDSIIHAGLRVQHAVDAVDLNYGCPQRCAEDAQFGAYFLEKNPDLACEIVRQLSKALRVPVMVKMRLHGDGLEATVALARRLQAAGASALTLHARYKWQREHEGPADWSVVRAVKAALGIPVIANGSIQCLTDANDCFEYTCVDAVMSGTGLLRHPTLFTDASLASPHRLPSADGAAVDEKSLRVGRIAAQRSLNNCYRYLDIVQCHLEGERGHGEGAVAVNGREARDVIRDHLVAMLQIHIMDNEHKLLCSRLLSKQMSSTIEQFRNTLDVIAGVFV
jgi:tRNA-dihydrouridine synthase